MSLSDPTALPGRPGTIYQQEASVFVGLMSDMASDLVLDYSVESIQRLDQFITDNFAPPTTNVGESLIRGIGCYLGEVIIRHLGGHWNYEGRPEIDGIGGEIVYPIDKAVKRFHNGSADSLNWYYHTLAKHAYENGHQQPRMPQRIRKEDDGGGLMGIFKGLFGK